MVVVVVVVVAWQNILPPHLHENAPAPRAPSGHRPAWWTSTSKPKVTAVARTGVARTSAVQRRAVRKLSASRPSATTAFRGRILFPVIGSVAASWDPSVRTVGLRPGVVGRGSVAGHAARYGGNRARDGCYDARDGCDDARDGCYDDQNGGNRARDKDTSVRNVCYHARDERDCIPDACDRARNVRADDNATGRRLDRSTGDGDKSFPAPWKQDDNRGGSPEATRETHDGDGNNHFRNGQKDILGDTPGRPSVLAEGAARTLAQTDDSV